MAVSELEGKHIRDYILYEQIGQGGMSVVYRAHQPSVNRDVAIKMMRVDKATLRDDFRERFAREAEVIAALEHIHILPVYDYGLEGDLAFLVMRLLRGGSLRDLIAEGPIPLTRSADLFAQFAQGLGYAHRRGVIHRDVKPSNILLDDMGNAFLTDFGLAKWIDHASQITNPDSVVGTLAYISPEVLVGSPVDHRSDIYSLGIVLYDMVAGRPPFDVASSGVATMLYQHLNVTPAAPSTINAQVSSEVDRVVLKALEKKPERRFQTADEMAEALNTALGRRDSTSTVPVLIRRRVESDVQIQSILLLLLGVMLAGLVAATLLIWWRGQSLETRRATVLAGESGTVESVEPSSNDRVIAQQRLGTDGFIAYVTCNQTSEYHATQAREVAQFAEANGLSVRIYDSDTDAYRQVTQLERARADGARGIILCVLDAELIDPALTSVQEAGTPLVLFNPGEKFYGGVGLGMDEFEMGQAAGRFAGEIIRDEMDGEARVLILDYPSLPNIVRRADGLEAGVLEIAPGASIVGRVLGGTVENGSASVRALIEEGTPFDVIVSINDAGVFGAIEAMDEAGFDPDSVVVASIDAESRALEYIREGHYLRGSLAVAREDFSRAAVDTMVMLLAGETVPEQILLNPGEMITRDDLP